MFKVEFDGINQNVLIWSKTNFLAANHDAPVTNKKRWKKIHEQESVFV